MLLQLQKCLSTSSPPVTLSLTANAPCPAYGGGGGVHRKDQLSYYWSFKWSASALVLAYTLVPIVCFTMLS